MLKETSEHRRVRIHQAVMGAKAGRYLVIRILAALVFFMNLYWALLLVGQGSAAIALPALNAAVSVLVLGEAAVCVSHTEDGGREYLAVSHKALAASAVLSLATGLASALGVSSLLFPFFSTGLFIHRDF